ncbi:MAG: S8 family serine peptidase, partial [Aureispira sp.]
MFNCFKFTLCTLVLLFTTTLAFAQSTTTYYWSDNQKISINTDRSSLILQFNDGYDVAKYLKANTTSLKDLEIHSIQGRAVLTFNNTVQGTALEVAKTFVSNAAALKSASFGYQLNDGFQVWPTHHVVLELRKDKTMADLSAVMTESKASFARAKYGRILLDVEDINQVLPLANQLRESGLVTWAHPDFYAKVQHHLTPSDPLYSNQFQMNNSNDVDSDAPEAWDITLGSAGISVAVIDDGLEAHPDLPTTNLSKGYSPANNGNGTPNSSGRHGVSCAGSISAAHNNIGVAGLAPNCEIFSVN